MNPVIDDEGREPAVPAEVRRVVSLVPSLTEAVEATAPGLVVGATDWCTHPAGLAAERVRGTKNPDVEKIVALAPDLVLANQEENLLPDLDALRDAGLPVYVTDIRDVDGGLASLGRMLAACRLAEPDWLREARELWAAIEPASPRRRAVVPIWRKPWMAVGSDTFTGAVLDRLGIGNVLDDSPERYPRFDPATLPEHDLVVLPDEPYLFTADDGPESFDAPSVLVSGRLLTWYGPSLVEAARELPAAFGLAAA
ncbi:ABC-type Fe3+-hydroxamate transport system, periplasmic component [Pseudonocardia sp. Ae168_Ps1]|uniref:helical backbone metal receptor n=1 Tax=unclassified Pseudonocardia TaxID=2619320 RepID=UPI00094B268B|nr:ABC-type Fe3+-hydroxamate transport system, periplasmic component [Pseudonocardia sp. Ae168_Ps1]OLL76966.1 ABC-type Fe3+-hydroxamate transport system, periplasmic component [Pseudonocardia sp. Ae150A_Ps1]OLL88922.1 ABC-type Fe3+-hydroxamate transport system, periplasmic component [Pseudonocardia sp. Ae263_Ps1]OLL91053.1 ABC-type Fe3+-hydroxamate transport system, periplasmic component [Pseudonocardia sp. Ae356_Ps1]